MAGNKNKEILTKLLEGANVSEVKGSVRSLKLENLLDDSDELFLDIELSAQLIS